MIKKPFDMVRANLLRSNLPLLEPQSEMLHHSAIQADSAQNVPATRKITSEGLRIYVKLAICLAAMNAIILTSLLNHNESGKPRGFSRPRHPSSYQIRIQFKTQKRKNSITSVHITEKLT
jgi:hypothetical protein